MKWLLPLLLALIACSPLAPSADKPMEDAHSAGRLSARPAAAMRGRAEAGLRQLGSGTRAAWLYVPGSYRPDKPMPFVLVLHGAGGSGQRTIETVRLFAEQLGFIALAPSSRAATWDIISNRSYGADVAPIDALLEQVFTTYSVDLERVAVGGFSDGASYALSLGVTNGDLFRKIIAFSPGFMAPGRLEGRPHIFISHGTEDRVLPIDICSRRIVPQLKRGGYEVDYREFRGGHIVPEDLARRAYESLAAT